MILLINYNFLIMKSLFKTFVAIFIFTLAFSPFTYAQKKSADGTIEVELRNIGAISDGKEVKGYYKFYMVEKVDRKNAAYLLEILDEDLNVIVSKKIIQSQGIVLLESAYNGKILFFKFRDTYYSGHTLYLYAFDINSESQYVYERPVGNEYEIIKYNENSGKNDLKSSTIFGITNHGFLNYGTLEDNGIKIRVGYTIEYFPDDTTKQGWVFQSEKKSDFYEFAEHLGANKDMVVARIEKTRSFGFALKNPFYYIAAFNIQSGEKLFEKELQDDKYKLLYVNGYIEEATGNIVVLGYYHEKGDLTVKEQLGLFVRTFDKQGNVINTSYVSWKEDVNKLIALDERGKLEDVGYVFFHNLVRTQTGKFYAIGESYRRGVTDVKMEKILVFEFSSAFKLENIKVFDKGISTVALNLLVKLNPLQMAMYVRSRNGFDYVFTQSSTSEDRFIIGYLHDESGKVKPEQTFGTITYADGEFTMDKIKLDTENEVKVFPAKPGYVMISEYSKKDKKMDLRLEKINY